MLTCARVNDFISLNYVLEIVSIYFTKSWIL